MTGRLVLGWCDYWNQHIIQLNNPLPLGASELHQPLIAVVEDCTWFGLIESQGFDCGHHLIAMNQRQMKFAQLAAQGLVAEAANGRLREQCADFPNHYFFTAITPHALALDIAAKQLFKGRVEVFYQDRAHGAEANQRFLGLGQEAEVVNNLGLLGFCRHRAHSIQFGLGNLHGLGE
ncbi:hypothetical protein D3C85_1129740 [compost metagenome]